MMQRWTYTQYKAAVKCDMDYALSTHGCLPAQAIGFAHNELALRLEEYPEEVALALVALGSKACTLRLLDAYPKDDAFIEEVLEHLQPSLLETIRNNLPDSEQEAFWGDAMALAQSLSGRKPLGKR
jgi:hypothetical protein